MEQAWAGIGITLRIVKCNVNRLKYSWGYYYFKSSGAMQTDGIKK